MSNLIKGDALDPVLQTLVTGDLARLSSEEKLSYYKQLCDSLGLNPLTKPFAYIKLNGKETLYATKDCTDQLRKIHNVSIKIPARECIDGVYVVTAQASLSDGRCDESTGAVSTGGLKGEILANAYLKCETKAKRRVTLSICGLGLLDETEVETIKDAAKVEEPKEATKVEVPKESVRLQIKTLNDIKDEHSKELQKAIQKDMRAASKPLPSIKPAYDFRVPAGFDTENNPGNYIARCGKEGGPIIGRTIKQLDADQQLSQYMRWLRNGASANYLASEEVQEFIRHADNYINLQAQDASEEL